MSGATQAGMDFSSPSDEGQEVELKLVLDPTQVAHLKRIGWLKPLQMGPVRTQKLDATYFDTAARDFRKEGISFRVRREGRHFVQAIKGAPVPAGGALVRSENEMVVPGGQPRLDQVDDAQIRALLDGDPANLQPCFRVIVTRQKRKLHMENDAEIAFDLDEGVVEAGDRTERFCELELELIRGRPSDLYGLAKRILDEVPLRISLQTKADRGYALATGDAGPVWSKARTMTLTPDLSAEQALQAIVFNGIDHMLANERCLVEDLHIEGVHQVRVATRRIRSALAIYKPLIPADQYENLNGRLRDFINRLGPARDLDVFLAETLVAVRAAMPEEGASLDSLEEIAVEARQEANLVARQAVAADDFTRMLLDLGSWAMEKGWREGADPAALAMLTGPVTGLAARELGLRHSKIHKKGRHFKKMTVPERHDMRIAIKKLRYATDFFNALYPAKRTAAYGLAMAGLQDLLGRMNDVAVARGLVDYLLSRSRGKRADRARLAGGFVVGWHKARGEGSEKAMRRAWKAYAAIKPFWD